MVSGAKLVIAIEPCKLFRLKTLILMIFARLRQFHNCPNGRFRHPKDDSAPKGFRAKKDSATRRRTERCPNLQAGNGNKKSRKSKDLRDILLSALQDGLEPTTP